MKLKQAMRASAWDANRRWASSSHSSVEKKLPAMALSKASPTDPIKGHTPASRQRFLKAMAVYWVNSTGRRNTLGWEVVMAGRRRSDRALRGKLRSPGRPPVAQQAHRRRFWELLAAGASSEDAAFGAGVSMPVGARWFRKSGGMPPSMLAPSSEPLCGRYLSFAEREELAIQHAQGAGVRQIARHMGRSGDGTLVNNGSLGIQGGTGSYDSSESAGGGVLSNTGDVTNANYILAEQGGSGNMGAPGQSGDIINDGTFSNIGSLEIRGGLGSNGMGAGGVNGAGPAALLNSGLFQNTGTIIADGGGGALDNQSGSGCGALIMNTGMLINLRTITLESGGEDLAQGGAGAVLDNTGTLTNSGTIDLKAGRSSPSLYVIGAAGVLNGSGTVFNTGSILVEGGTGIDAQYGPFSGQLDVASLFNSGTLVLGDDSSNFGIAAIGTLVDTGAITGNGLLQTGTLVAIGSDVITVGTLLDEGTIDVKGALTINAVMSGFNGVIAVDPQATAILNGPVSPPDVFGNLTASETIIFAGNTGTVEFGSAAAGTYGTFDVADLEYVAGSTSARRIGDLLMVTNGIATDTFTVNGELDGTTFSVRTTVRQKTASS